MKLPKIIRARTEREFKSAIDGDYVDSIYPLDLEKERDSRAEWKRVLSKCDDVSVIKRALLRSAKEDEKGVI